MGVSGRGMCQTTADLRSKLENCCRFRRRLIPTLSGLARGEHRQITLSVNDLTISCRTSSYLSVA
jgi:hypothetical protein